MDPQTLPAKELAIYEKIKSQFKVAFEPLTVQQHRLNLLKYTDLEEILDGKDPFKNPSEFPVWIRLWESAIVLADFLADQQPKPGTTMLELGAGLGATGLVAAAAGFEVTLSDYEERILEFQQINAAASGLTGVRFKLLDWLQPTALEQYDVIIGSEILYREDFLEPLLAIFQQALKPGGVIFLAHDEGRQNVAPFLRLAEETFSIGMTRRKLKSLDKDKVILLTRLKRRD
ncbi:class I SAM-dependent methyltransferase [Desulfogranum mediterraneum]|uniref:class I SAM-dependent methyltransferase n=1 Tax=Desulfogranum mediterraneum TaxID=160661 RepID=UPI0004191C34|nr:methyltransferase domain-containing protein [Desulfogranum mediterraneum]